MFNLNDTNFGGGITVFNNGNTGVVENVKIDVTRKSATDKDNAPDYKLILTDVAGGQLGVGFYYHQDNDMFDAETNKKKAVMSITRVLDAAKAVVPEGHQFPQLDNPKEIFDMLFKTIKDNCEGKLVRTYVTYGTTMRPSQYLNTRFFNYIESMNVPVEKSKLRKSNNDQMTKVEADAPQQDSAGTSPAANW